MAIERRIRHLGHKTVAYSWLRRYVVIGPYNRKVRQDTAAILLVKVFDTAARKASETRRSRGKGKPG